MPTSDEAIAAIYKHFQSAWGTTTLLVVDNQTEELPDDSQTPWARLSVRPTTGEQRSMAAVGARRFTNRGNIFVQVFTPLGILTQQANNLADIALKAFQGKRTSNPAVHFFNAGIAAVGAQEGRWWQTNVTCQYSYDEVL